MNERTLSFGYWLRRRRKALDLTQEELAQAVSCSRFAIRKIESDERRPSRRLAERLAERLGVAAAERDAFIAAARALRPVEQLQVDVQPLQPGTAAHEPQATQSAAAPPSDSRLVGRDSEFGQLTGLLARVASGEGHVALLEGEPGIGKSHLMREVARYAAAKGIRALAATCYEIERSMPYQPVIELAAQAADLCTSATLRKLPPIALAEIAGLVPSVAEGVAGLPALSVDFPEARQARLFRAIVQLIDVLGGGRQVVITVDDIHWADDTSRQFLHYLARHVAARPVLLILAYRGEEVDADESLSNFVRSVRREGNARHFPLARLSVTDAESLLAQCPGERVSAPGLAQWLHRESEGNPFFLMSIIHSLAEQDAHPANPGTGEPAPTDCAAPDGRHATPEALRAAVRARLHRVPRELRSHLEFASVLGRRFDFESLQALSGTPQPALLDAIEALVKRQLLREEPEGGIYDFSHDKIREVVYLDIGATRRMLTHRAVAEALEQREPAYPHEFTACLAEHYERGQVWPKAIRYLVAAAAHAEQLFAMREALRWFDRAAALADAHPEALDESARHALIEQRGRARAQAGQTAGAVADFRHVMDAARRHGARERVRALLVELGMAYRRADAYEQATTCLNEALAAAREMNDERHAADTLYHLGTVAWSNGRNRDAIRFHQEAVEICQRLRLADRVGVQAFHGRGEAHFAFAEPHRAIECYTRSLEYARGIGDRSYESENLMMIGWACTGIMGLGDYARALEHYESALRIAREADLQWHLGPTLLGRDHARGCLGEYRSAWAGLNETLELLESLGLVRYQLMAHELTGHLLLDLNRNGQAGAVLERGLGIARDTNVMFWQPRLRASLAIARVRAGRFDVLPDLGNALATARENRERYLETRCLEALAEASLTRGDLNECLAAADQLLAIAQPNGMLELTATALRWRGEALIADRRFDPARETLASASEITARIARPRLSWELHGTLARLARGIGATDDERQHRSAARDIEERIASGLRGTDLGFEPVAGSGITP